MAIILKNAPKTNVFLFIVVCYSYFNRGLPVWRNSLMPVIHKRNLGELVNHY